MTKDIDALMSWITACLVVTAICTTAFPLMYSVSKWHRTRLGQILMVQSASLAAAIDLTLLFTFWTPKNVLVIFWVNAAIFTLLAFSSAALTAIMWDYNHSKNKREKRNAE